MHCSESSIGMVVSESCERDADTALALRAGPLLGSHRIRPLCLSAKAKPEERPEETAQGSEEPHREEKAKLRPGVASVRSEEERRDSANGK